MRRIGLHEETLTNQGGQLQQTLIDNKVTGTFDDSKTFRDIVSYSCVGRTEEEKFAILDVLSR